MYIYKCQNLPFRQFKLPCLNICLVLDANYRTILASDLFTNYYRFFYFLVFQLERLVWEMQQTELFICHLDNSRIFSMRNWFIEFKETEGIFFHHYILCCRVFGMWFCLLLFRLGTFIFKTDQRITKCPKVNLRQC